MRDHERASAPGHQLYWQPCWPLLLVLGMACGRSVVEPEGSPPGAGAAPRGAVVARASRPEPEPEPLSPSALARITPQRLHAHVERLADDRLRGRPTPSPQLDEAADYVLEQMRAQGLRAPQLAPEHVQRFECGGPEHPGLASNVLALLPGRDPELAEQTVMVTAHYDHIGERAFGEDRIFNGANDDASGTAAMLAIAEALSVSPRPPRRSVLFVAFCGEERGLRGSYHYAEHPVRPLEQVVAHVNLEMLGRASPEDPSSGALVAWLPGMMRSELGEWLTAANPDGKVTFLDGFAIGAEEGAAFDRSDNYPLARQHVVAHTVAAGTIDALYHSPDDEADRLDYERMSVIVQAVARGVWRLAEHEGQPGWFDPPQ
ncbi:M28 family metallopeptidase [Paraliomyxa miuraensis]|uniref:M28 family metallopeptidase n=1 Tax=Paraliomyxa miuraensis TaxID=376150 RepID=UPI00224E8F47|nr:M28 family peptidase [Paraliomyxa miuraensis]MCX4247579.1 M28 family peptidase [Paraliomyxa miuraensis]